MPLTHQIGNFDENPLFKRDSELKGAACHNPAVYDTEAGAVSTGTLGKQRAAEELQPARSLFPGDPRNTPDSKLGLML